MTNNKSKPKHRFMRLGTDGTAIRKKRLEDGSFRTSPQSLLNTNSDYSRLLNVLYRMGGMHSGKEITRLYRQKYAKPITANQVSARLSELYTLSLVDRTQSKADKRVALYSIMPDIDISDQKALYERANVQLCKLLGKAKQFTLANSPAAIIFEVS